MPYTIADPPPGCTCGAWMSILPPPPCPHHSPVGYEWRLVPVYPQPTTRWYQTTTTTGTITVSNPTTYTSPVVVGTSDTPV